MDKTIVMRVTLSIQGDVPAVQDFAKTGQDVASAILAAGIKAAGAPYNVTVRKVEPVEGGDDDMDADADTEMDVDTEPAPRAAPAANPASAGTAAASSGASQGSAPAAHPSTPATPEPPTKPSPR
jgi:hypothetical protein